MATETSRSGDNKTESHQMSFICLVSILSPVILKTHHPIASRCASLFASVLLLYKIAAIDLQPIVYHYL